MLKKIKNLKNYNYDANIAFVRKLEQNSKFVQPINLLINLVYKLKQKIKKNLLGRLKINPSLDFGQQNILFNKNVNLFSDSVLIIAELSIPQCTKYRVTQKVEMLKELGKNVNVVSWHDETKFYQLMQISGSVIFYRVPACDSVKKAYQITKRLGISTYYDVDDLIFDREKLAENKSLHHLSVDELKQLYKGADLYREALLLADYAIASTKCLADEMQLVTNKPVFVLHNAIDNKSLAVRAPILSSGERCRIVYGSGTNTHNEDFAIAADAILQILEKFPTVDFVIYGYLDLDSRFDAFESQILRVPFVSADDYYRALASCDIAIAPLTKNIFNDCKSNIKFLESSLYKLPSVCSPLYEFSAAIRHGYNGFLADTSQDWYNSLTKLIQNKALRCEVATNAYNDVMAHYHWQSIVHNELSQIFPRLKKNNKRILLVNVLYKPDSFGGATIIVEETAKELKRQGFEVLVFCGTFEPSIPFGSYERYDIDGVSVVRIRVAYHADKTLEYNNPANEEIFTNIVRGFGPDIVHFHSIQLLGANLVNICIQDKVPYVITLHDAWWFCERQFMLNKNNQYCNNAEGFLAKCANCVENSALNHKRRFYLNDLCNNANLLLATSQFQKDLYITAGFDSDKIKVNKNGIIEAKEVISTKTENIPITFAYLGGHAEHKGFYWLNDIFASISGDFILKIVNLEARMGANINYKEDLKDIPRNKYEILPPFNQDQIDDFFADIDVLLFPSQWKESFGLTVREAMLRDVWVISTDCGGPVEDIIDGLNGNVIEFGNKQLYIDAVQNILANADYYKNYKNNNKHVVRLIKEQIAELVGYYEQIIGINESN